MVSCELRRELEDFLIYEARLLDEAKYDDWLELLSDDVRYWMPVRDTLGSLEGGVRGGDEMALFDDDKDFLKVRIQRLHSGLAHAETPPSRTRHFLTNFEFSARAGGEFDVRCNMLVYQSRLERTEATYVGYRDDRLRRAGASFKIARRKIVLDQTLLPRTISILL